MKTTYNECAKELCERLTKHKFCKSCEEDDLRRETREVVYENDIDLNEIYDNRRIRA